MTTAFSSRGTTLSPWAGLVLGTSAWAISTQLNYTLSAAWCASSHAAMIAATIACFIAAVIGAVVSWLGFSAGGELDPGHQVSAKAPMRLMCGVSMLCASLFAITILTQLVGILTLGCER
jgi:hypothetical protein